jgi:hypothetical protein
MNITRFLSAGALLLIGLVGIEFTQQPDANHQIMAVKYNENKQTTVTMSGTAITPRVTGKAEVEYKQGRARIRLEMEALAHPQSLGVYYTTYVLWAVAPEGQAEIRQVTG